VVGPATSQEVLRDALIEDAKVVVVALGRDDTAVLATLTARRLAPHVTVVAAAREAENAELLQQSGASSVIVSSEATGRLPGLATDSPHVVSVVGGLLSFGQGLDLVERDVRPDEMGRPRSTSASRSSQSSAAARRCGTTIPPSADSPPRIGSSTPRREEPPAHHSPETTAAGAMRQEPVTSAAARVREP